MLNIKKTTLAMLVLSSSAAFAGAMGPVGCVTGNVSLPCEKTAWQVGLYGLYLQPSYNGHPRIFNFAGSTIDTAGLRTHSELKKEWQWGFLLDASYYFSTGNDFNINWYHWNGSDSSNLNYVSETTGNEIFETPHNVKSQWNAVNLDVGQQVNFGEFKKIRFHGGVQLARLDYKEADPYREIPLLSGDEITGVYRLELRFTGIGPHVGADMSYDCGNGVAIYANGSAALLVGDTKTYDLSTFNPNRASHTAIVPELEGKIGGKYTLLTTCGGFTVDAGYQVNNYFNAFQVVQAEIDGVSDFGLQGPYIGLKWVPNV